MKITKEITVYATVYSGTITTDLTELISAGVDSGDIDNYETWLEENYTAADILDLVEKGINPQDHVYNQYVDYCTNQIEYLVDAADDWWKDTITVEVEVN
jgi:hypothetical protein